MADIEEKPSNGGQDLVQVQAAAIQKLKKQIECLEDELTKRDSDVSYGRIFRRGKQVAAMFVGVIATVVVVLGYFELRTEKIVEGAQAAELVKETERTRLAVQRGTARYAPMSAVVLQEQRLTQIDRALNRIEDKLDRLIAPSPPRRTTKRP